MNQMLKQENDFKKTCVEYAIMAVIGTLIFGIYYGYAVVNPLYTDWCMAGGDLTQEYLGWKAFRADDWHFPVGIMSNLAYPNDVSVIYTDSIPCLAVLFKVFQAVLPNDFQYLGVWGLASFILTAIFSYRIFSKLIENSRNRIIAASIVCLSPPILQRMFAHTSLGGQWVILFTIDALATYNLDKNWKKLLVKVGILAFLSSSIHPYFILINGIILAGECLYIFLKYKKIAKSFLIVAEYCCVGLFTLYCLGAFCGGGESAAWGLGYNSFNLNALLNPQGFSKIIKDLPLWGEYQYEGFAYLGIGVLILLLFAIIAFISDGTKAIGFIKTHWQECVSITAVVIVALIISASNIVTLNGHVLFHYPVVGIFYKGWSVFRASGRVAWIIMYFFAFMAIAFSCKYVKNTRTVMVLLIVCLCLQFYDLSDAIKERHICFSEKQTYESSVQDSNKVVAFFENNEEFKHAVLIHHYYAIDLKKLYDLTAWSIDNKKTFNTFFLARSIDEYAFENIKKSLANPSESELYICDKDKKLAAAGSNLHWYDAGEFLFGCVKRIDGMTELKESDYCPQYVLGDNIVFSDVNEYNANLYIIDGISGKEASFSWTDARELNMGFVPDKKVERLHCDIDLEGVYRGAQRVIVTNDNKVVFDNTVDENKKKIEFDFYCDSEQDIVRLKFEFPDCSSPHENGESLDTRRLALAIRNISFVGVQ